MPLHDATIAEAAVKPLSGVTIPCNSSVHIVRSGLAVSMEGSPFTNEALAPLCSPTSPAALARRHFKLTEPAAVRAYGSVYFPLCVVQPSPVPSGRGLLELTCW